MKKHLLIALVLSLAWPVSAAPADQAVAKQLLVTQFQQIKDDAAQCREAVRKQNFKKAISLGQRALTKETEALALAKKNNIRVTFGQVYGSDGFLPDPLTNYVDVAENVLFSRVMSGEISLREALRQGADLADKGGMVGVLFGQNTHMNIAFATVSETFRGWKNCKKEVATLNGMVDPEKFCVQDPAWLAD